MAFLLRQLRPGKIYIRQAEEDFGTARDRLEGPKRRGSRDTIILIPHPPTSLPTVTNHPHTISHAASMHPTLFGLKIYNLVNFATL